MKKTIYTPFLILAFLLGLSVQSCHQEDRTPTPGLQPFSFGFVAVNPESGKLRAEDLPAKVRLSALSKAGENVYPDQTLDLFSFGGGYVSETITLPVDEYELTLFQVLNEQGHVIMATPLQGSEKANLVEQPLPISFAVAEGQTNRLSPEVLWVGEYETPGQFGYVEFGFELVNRFDLDVQVSSGYDGSSIPAFISLRSYGEDSLIIDQKTYPYQANLTTVNLDTNAHFYELFVEAAFYHKVKYYLKTNDLMAMEQLEFILSPVDFAHQFTLSPVTRPFENEMKLYLPRNGCTKYIRLDRTGIPSFYTHLSYAVIDQRTGTSLILPEMIESYEQDPGHIIYPVHTPLGNVADDICALLNEQHEEDLAFAIEVFVMTDDGENMEFFVYHWNSETGEWMEGN